MNFSISNKLHFSILSTFLMSGLCFVSSQDAVAQTVEVQINGTSSFDDDYLCWSPRPARARLVGLAAAGVDIVLESESISAASTGVVQFQEDAGAVITSENFAPVDNLSVSLPGNGSWVNFYVAGKEASTTQKDLSVLARSPADNTVLGSVQAMVRVRKDARRLTSEERTKFLKATRDLHNAGDFDKYWRAHRAAFRNDIHFMFRSPHPPLFLAWHRAYLLSFERELQKIDSDVALPYWKFDEPSFLPGKPWRHYVHVRLSRRARTASEGSKI